MLQGGVEPVSDTYLILHTTIHRPVLLRYFLWRIQTTHLRRTETKSRDVSKTGRLRNRVHDWWANDSIWFFLCITFSSKDMVLYYVIELDNLVNFSHMLDINKTVIHVPLILYLLLKLDWFLHECFAELPKEHKFRFKQAFKCLKNINLDANKHSNMSSKLYILSKV